LGVIFMHGLMLGLPCLVGRVKPPIMYIMSSKEGPELG
jgi:hypothetical protein